MNLEVMEESAAIDAVATAVTKNENIVFFCLVGWRSLAPVLLGIPLSFTSVMRYLWKKRSPK